jgi:hypothetical protein
MVDNSFSPAYGFFMKRIGCGTGRPLYVRPHQTMSAARFMFGVFLASSIFWTGCRSGQVELFLEHPINQTFARHSNPIEGWQEIYIGRPDKAIEDDYRDYINKLPPKKRESATSIHSFEDGTGQHAVSIRVWLDGMWDGTEWVYVLIYDRNDKRVKVIKYLDGYYSL